MSLYWFYLPFALIALVGFLTALYGLRTLKMSKWWWLLAGLNALFFFLHLALFFGVIQ